MDADNEGQNHHPVTTANRRLFSISCLFCRMQNQSTLMAPNTKGTDQMEIWKGPKKSISLKPSVFLIRELVNFDWQNY
ncbi:hypothetical protein PO909_017081 [Leuciscus waleckii]